MSHNIILEKYDELNEFFDSVIIPKLIEFHQAELKYIDSYTSDYSDWKNSVGNEDDKSKIFSSTAEIHRKLEKKLQNQNTKMN